MSKNQGNLTPNYKKYMNKNSENLSVNEESDEEGYEDEGYKSLIDTAETGRKNRRRRKPDVETLSALDGNTKDELMEKILILKEAYDDLKGKQSEKRL